MDPVPFSSLYDLANLSEAGTEVSVVANTEQRARMARWADLEAVDDFEARIFLRQPFPGRFTYDAKLSAGITQTCVVTLGPVRSHLVLDISRTLHLSKIPRGTKIAPQEFTPTADEDPEEIHDSRYDLASPLLEEFALVIDPYPRCAGVAFEPPLDEGETESPFGVLKSTKGQS